MTSPWYFFYYVMMENYAIFLKTMYTPCHEQHNKVVPQHEHHKVVTQLYFITVIVLFWWRLSRCSVCFLYPANRHLSLHVCMSKISLSCQTHDINPIKIQGPLYLWYGSSAALSCNMHVLLHTVTSGALVNRLWQPVYFTQTCM